MVEDSLTIPQHPTHANKTIAKIQKTDAKYKLVVYVSAGILLQIIPKAMSCVFDRFSVVW